MTDLSLSMPNKEKKSFKNIMDEQEQEQALYQKELAFLNQKKTFLMAAKNGETGQVLTLLYEKPKLFDAMNFEGNKAFHLAAQFGRHETVEWLFKYDKKIINQVNMNGDTALMLAARKGCAQVVYFLMAQNADLDRVNYQGRSAYRLAKIGGYDNLASAIIEAKKSLSNVLRDEDAYNSTSVAQPKNGYAADSPPFLHSPSLDSKRLNGNEHLFLMAAGKGITKAVTWFLEKRVNANVTNGEGYNALMFAVINQKREIFDILTSTNININAVHPEYGTALIMAVRRRNIYMVVGLKDRSDRSIQDSEGYTALMHAALMGDDALVRVLTLPSSTDKNKDLTLQAIEQRADISMMLAAREGHTKVVECLLSSVDLDVNSQDLNGDTALMHAVYGGHIETVVALLKANANVHSLNNEENPQTPLSLAVGMDKQEIAFKLLEKMSDDELESLERYPFFTRTLAAFKNRIVIEDVEGLVADLSLKSSGPAVTFSAPVNTTQRNTVEQASTEWHLGKTSP